MRLHTALDDELVAQLDRRRGAWQRSALICLDTFHVIGWATGSTQRGPRVEWTRLPRAGQTNAPKELKGLLRRTGENLTGPNEA